MHRSNGALRDTTAVGVPWSLIITTVGAVATTLLGVFVGGAVGSRSQQRSWSRDRQADACAAILRESSKILIELADMNGRRVNPRSGEVADPPGLPTPIDWRPWNDALDQVNLLADSKIAEAAQAIDREIWPVHLQIKNGETREGDWYPLRDRIETRRRTFVDTARSHLGSSGPPLRRLGGRPDPDDPIWRTLPPQSAETASVQSEEPLSP